MQPLPQEAEFDLNKLELVALEDEAFAVSADAGIIFHLNAAGRHVVEASHSGASLEELAEIFAEEGGVSSAHALNELVSFKDILKQNFQAAHDLPRKQQKPASPLKDPLTSATYELFGRLITIEYPDQNTAAICHPPLEPFQRDGVSEGELRVTIIETPEEISMTCDRACVNIPNMPGALMTALQRVLVCHDVRSPGLFGVVVHAGAVIGCKGAWLIGGASGQGKSTLVARLDEAGRRVLSDDLVPLDLFKELAFPMPLALSVKESGWSVVSGFRPELWDACPTTTMAGKRVRYLKPKNPATDADRSGTQIAGVLLPNFKQGAPASIEPIGLKQAMICLCDRFGRFPVEPADLRQLIELLTPLPRFRLTYGNVDDVLPEVLARL